MKKLRTTGRVFVLGLIVSVLLAFGLSSNARADSLTFSLTVANPNLATQGAGPYASVTITGSGTSWSVTATGQNGFVFGDGGVFALNLSSAAGTGTFVSGTGLSQTAAGNEDGFGSFNFVLNDGSGFSSPMASLSFTFTTTGSVSGVAALLALNDHNADIAGHLALSTNLACTGFAANTGATKPTGSPDNSACVTSGVPEPSSAALLFVGAMLIGGTYLLRRRETDYMAI